MRRPTRLVGLIITCHCAAAFVLTDFSGTHSRIPRNLKTSVQRTCSSFVRIGAAQSTDRRCALGQSKVQTEVERSLEGSIGGAQFWAWKNGWQIHYTQSGQDGPPLLLLTGFGVGGFHYARNVEELSKNHKVWTMDVLGQGKSWPTTDPAPGGGFSEAGFQWGFGSASDADTNAASLDYSCSLWTRQAIEFLETVVRQVDYCCFKSMFHACLNRL